MFTVLLAFIEAKFNHGYQLLFFGTIFIDLIFMLVIAEMVEDISEAIAKALKDEL